MPRKYTRIPLEQRFWRFVGRTEACWNWTGARYGFGYGVINEGRQGRVRAAHRVSWEIHFGKIPDDMCVCHRCDNPGCVNPAHLFLGTRDDNNKDMRANGRYDRVKRPKGERHGGAKLTSDKIRAIRHLWSSHPRPLLRELGAAYGVTTTQIHRIVTGKGWAHI